jgi:methyltransferase family protein
MRFVPANTGIAGRVVRALRGFVARFRWVRKYRLLRHYGAALRDDRRSYLAYLLWDPELDNFTYDLANEDELAAVIATALQRPEDQIAAFIREAHSDPRLRSGLNRRLLAHKRTPRYGRRLGWYAAVRALKPDLVGETGIHAGLGSALLLAALERNAAEGHEGRLVSVDTNPGAGWLVPDSLRGRWTRLVGSSYEQLPSALDGHEVGVFIHDSDHSYECEHFELTTARAHAAPSLALITDNAHVTDAIKDVARDTGAAAYVFRERPADHFYPGAALGIALLRRTSDPVSDDAA